MKNNLIGKKLLVLGATPNEIPLVKRAQELGIYVITTDYNKDYTLSPAKNVSDECWDISWSDLDTLQKKCIESGVNGITAGFSEIRVENMIKLCERLGLPCYITKEQLAITRDKILFKETCRKYGIPTIKEYENIANVDKYPVIVKPTDRAGSIGVGIANNDVELHKVFQVAMEKSIVKKVIIEEYISDAIEMDVHYAVCEGEVTLLTTDDIIPAAGNVSDGKVVQSAWMYPSKYNDDFLKKIDKKMKKMIEGMGIKNGTIFFSGFVDKNGDFSFFECGFRLWGEQEFTYDYYLGNVNYLDIYIYHALLGTTAGIDKNEDGNINLKGIALNLYVKGGVIACINGLNEISQMDDCYLCIVDSYIGQECTFNNAILTKAGLVGFANTDPYILKENVMNAYSIISILNCEHIDMLYDRINVDLIENWWGKSEKY